jgi:hypothetical protein
MWHLNADVTCTSAGTDRLKMNTLSMKGNLNDKRDRIIWNSQVGLIHGAVAEATY